MTSSVIFMDDNERNKKAGKHNKEKVQIGRHKTDKWHPKEHTELHKQEVQILNTSITLFTTAWTSVTSI